MLGRMRLICYFSDKERLKKETEKTPDQEFKTKQEVIKEQNHKIIFKVSNVVGLSVNVKNQLILLFLRNSLT